MKFNDIITVYSVIPRQGRTPEHLQRAVIKEVFWDGTFGAGFSKRGKDDRDSITVMIHDRADLPKLKAGDIILRGKHGDAASAAEACGFTAEHFAVTSVRDCRYGSRNMHHWEVVGK